MRDKEQIYGNEVLVKTTSNVVRDMTSLKSLMPYCPVDQEILNLVIARQNWCLSTLGNTKSIWYMPTEFAVINTTNC
ncbi:unnamed protein product [Lathyrus sativus]|nr:unnamed protein product [Lathyrus sativus]